MAGPAVRVDGLRELQRGLKAMQGDLDREFRDELKQVGTRTAEEARGRAQGGTRQQARGAYNIESGASMKGATIGVKNTSEEPFTLGAFWGSKRPQFPGLPWVGSSWDAGAHGQGPYHINEALADNADRIEEDLGDLIDRLAVRTRAFPS